MLREVIYFWLILQVPEVGNWEVGIVKFFIIFVLIFDLCCKVNISWRENDDYFPLC